MNMDLNAILELLKEYKRDIDSENNRREKSCGVYSDGFPTVPIYKKISFEGFLEWLISKE